MSDSVTQQPQYRRYKRWFLISFYTIVLVAGQSTATLLGRIYFDKGGKSRWIATFIQSAGFPILLPLILYFPNKNSSRTTKPKSFTIFFVYVGFGLLLTGTDMMYSCGISYLPLSTYALICATQLGFNAVFTFFINSQKFTPLIFNSIVLLTMSLSLLAINVDSETLDLPREKQVIGFFCSLGASATFSLHQSLVQLCFEKVIKAATFSAVLNMQFYPDIIAAAASTVGLFVSGEWKTLKMEMNEFEKGRVSYIMTLIFTAVTWQISLAAMLGLIFEVSSLFSVVIGTLELPIAPILAVIVFHDKINGVKVIALFLAIWGFLSYMYQHYLDDQKAKSDDLELSKEEPEI